LKMPASKQVKVSIDPKVAIAFKAACVASDTSMAAELSAFMSDRARVLNESAEKRLKTDSLETRGKRRRQVSLIIARLVSIKEFEEAYQQRIPENLQESQAYENSSHSIDVLEEAINLLEDAY